MVGLVAAIGLLALLVISPQPSDIGGDELDGAVCVLNERLIRIRRPVRLSGRPDQVWRRRDRVLVVVDTKRRRAPRIYESDRVQLSAYRFLLKHTNRFRNEEIADHGFIRTESKSGAARFMKVDLLDDDEVLQLYKRAKSLRNSSAAPTANPSKALCRGCGHRGRCADAA